MSAPRYVDCRCSHGKADHDREGFTPQCTASACTCLQYRPGTATVTPRPNLIRPPITPPREPAPTDRGPTLEQVLSAGKRSEFKRTVQLTEKIAAMIDDLRGRLSDERETADEKRRQDEAAERVKAEIAQLEAQLAERRRALRGNPTPRTPGGSRQEREDCPTCGLPFANLGVHRFRKHGYRKDGVA